MKETKLWFCGSLEDTVDNIIIILQSFIQRMICSSIFKNLHISSFLQWLRYHRGSRPALPDAQTDDDDRTSDQVQEQENWRFEWEARGNDDGHTEENQPGQADDPREDVSKHQGSQVSIIIHEVSWMYGENQRKNHNT